MRLNNFVLMDEVGDDTKGGAGGGSEDKGAAAEQQIALLTKTVGLLAEGLQKMEANQSDIVSALAKITEQSPKQVEQQMEKQFGDDVDLEQLSRKDLAAYIASHVSTKFEENLKKIASGIDEKITNLAASFDSKNAREQIDKTAEKNPDFWEWSAEMKQLLAENPTLSVTRAYNLVKAENPEKVKELSKKYDKPAAKNEKSFIGLTPTSSLGTRDKAGKMTQNEAAEKAFDAIMADLGDVIQNGDMRIA